MAVQAEMDGILVIGSPLPAGVVKEACGLHVYGPRKDPVHLSLHCHSAPARMQSQASNTNMAIKVVRQLDRPSQRSAPAYL